MLRLEFHVDGEERKISLSDLVRYGGEEIPGREIPGREIHFGRSGENDVVLPDYSVSRRHAVIRSEGDGAAIHDLRSTNGVKVNGEVVAQHVLRAGDRVEIGVFELRVVEEAEESGRALDDEDEAGAESAISNATIVRSLKDLSTELGLLDPSSLAASSLAEGAADGARAEPDSARREQRAEKRQALDQAYASNVFGVLARLAKLLIATDSDEEILRHLMDVAFEVFPVDRGFILLREEDGELRCELARTGDAAEYRPSGPVPISETMLQAVMRERVALLTYDALSDRRLAGTESVRIHQIRAAMCTPLWSGEKIIGVLQLDTPQMGTFTEPDVDLLATLANYGAVAIERNHNARDAEYQREVRNRLQRYHSPAVIEEVLRDDPASADEGFRRLRRAEASVLFADIVGFTAYSEHADPEEVATLMERYFTYAVEAIFRYGGTLDKFIGDCVMAFFGPPFEHPDHAYRAVAAAMAMREDLVLWNAERASQGLSPVAVRTAINTGPVVVGDIGSNRRVDYTVLGNTVNVAARLEERVAGPGDIVLGDATCRALEGRIVTESLGGFQLKGLSREIQAHRVPEPSESGALSPGASGAPVGDVP